MRCYFKALLFPGLHPKNGLLASLNKTSDLNIDLHWEFDLNVYTLQTAFISVTNSK